MDNISKFLLSLVFACFIAGAFIHMFVTVDTHYYVASGKYQEGTMVWEWKGSHKEIIIWKWL